MFYTILSNIAKLWQNCLPFLINIFTTEISIFGWEFGLIVLLTFALTIIISGNKYNGSNPTKELTLESLIQNLDYSIWVLDKDLRFTFFNEKFKKNTQDNINKGIFLGQSILELLDTSQEKDYWTSFLRTGFNGEAIKKEATFQNRHFKFSLFPIKKKEKITHVIVISNEITAQVIEAEKIKTFEKAAAKSETTLQSLVNNIQNSVWAIDTNLCLTFYNENFRNSIKRIYNIEIELGKPLFDKLQEEEKKYWTGKFNKALTGERINSEIKRGGRTFQFSINPILVNDEITGVFVISIDLTEKLNQEEAIRKSEITLNSIVSKINDSFLALDKELKYTHYNERHKQFINELFGTEIKIGEPLVKEGGPQFSEFTMSISPHCYKALKGEPSNFEIKFSDNRSM